MRSYWRRVHDGAISEARALLGLGSTGQILLRVVLAFAVVTALLLWGSQEAVGDELIFRAVAVAFVLLLFPILYVYNFVVGLPRPALESEAENAKLKERVHELEQPAERVQAHVMQRYTGTLAGSGNFMVCFWLSVRNLGNRASSVVNWRMEWTYDGQRMCALADYFDNMRLESTVTLNADDNITEKTIAPVQPGAVVNGYFYRVLEASFDINRMEDVILVGETVSGVRIEAPYAAGGPDTGYIHPPGMKSRREFD